VSRRGEVKLGRFSEQTEKRIDVLLKSLSCETAKKEKKKKNPRTLPSTHLPCRTIQSKLNLPMYSKQHLCLNWTATAHWTIVIYSKIHYMIGIKIRCNY